MGILLLNLPIVPDPLYEMNFFQAQQLVLDRWLAGWTFTPWRVEPNPLNPPLAIGSAPWASISYAPIARGRQHTLGAVGARKFERTAILFVELHTPVGQGLTVMTNLTQEVADLFEGWSIGGLHGREVMAQDPINDSNEYVVVVECTFTYYERK